ncbi:hypothetical protein D0U04_18700 [Bacillus clarus]|uniref:NlpC/P60 family protein n=1 Tax=Bacillus clarus TaxID=2338372 RepID=A0A090YKF1_9BACI|nr:nlpC/P60 family protein [Bacillus clarus]RFT65518.1 hypothetical protein D0U04_18700 [Bacillus clarus]
MCSYIFQVVNFPLPTGDDLVNIRKLFLRLQYIWAGASCFGFDRSSFTHKIYKSHGITIPRDSGPQSKAGIAVERGISQKFQNPTIYKLAGF